MIETCLSKKLIVTKNDNIFIIYHLYHYILIKILYMYKKYIYIYDSRPFFLLQLQYYY